MRNIKTLTEDIHTYVWISRFKEHKQQIKQAGIDLRDNYLSRGHLYDASYQSRMEEYWSNQRLYSNHQMNRKWTVESAQPFSRTSWTFRNPRFTKFRQAHFFNIQTQSCYLDSQAAFQSHLFGYNIIKSGKAIQWTPPKSNFHGIPWFVRVRGSFGKIRVRERNNFFCFKAFI